MARLVLLLIGLCNILAAEGIRKINGVSYGVIQISNSPREPTDKLDGPLLCPEGYRVDGVRVLSDQDKLLAFQLNCNDTEGKGAPHLIRSSYLENAIAYGSWTDWALCYGPSIGPPRKAWATQIRFLVKKLTNIVKNIQLACDSAYTVPVDSDSLYENESVDGGYYKRCPSHSYYFCGVQGRWRDFTNEVDQVGQTANVMLAGMEVFCCPREA